MSIDRLQRVNELLRREIGEALFHVMQEAEFDLSAVSIVRVAASRNLRQAHVRVSIRDHHEERQRMMGLLRKHRAEIQRMINRDLVLKYTPKLSFELDTSVERGDHILDILNDLEQGESRRPEVADDDARPGGPAMTDEGPDGGPSPREST